MGTNYYLRENICEKCGRYDELHIGKKSAGWSFAFHGYIGGSWPEEMIDIQSWADWKKRLSNGKIFNEYNEEVSLEDFTKIVVESKSEPNNHTIYVRKRYPESARNCWLDEEGYSFSAYEFS